MNLKEKNNLFLKFDLATILKLKKQKKITDYDIVSETISKTTNLQKKFFFWNDFNKNLKTKIINNFENKKNFLQNIPFGAKDIFNSKELTTEMGSELFKGHQAGNDARAIYNLLREGAILAGKTVTAEFAVHKLNQTLNPHNIKNTPGTSSSGSAVAVCLGVVPFALATQTAGSIIRPASFNGIYGFKPSFGLIPRTGILKTTDTLDTIGFFCIHAKDIKIIFEKIILTGNNYPIANKYLTKKFNKRLKGAYIENLFFKDTKKNTKKNFLEFIKKLIKNKIYISKTKISNDFTKIHEIHELLYCKSLKYYFDNELRKNSNIEKISSQFIELTEKGKNISLNDYKKALLIQNNLMKKINNFFEKFDFIIMPSTAGPAPKRGNVEDKDTSLIWTFLHLPSINIPLFTEKGLPYGIQIVFPKYKDYQLIELVNALVKKKLIPSKSNPCLYKI